MFKVYLKSILPFLAIKITGHPRQIMTAGVDFQWESNLYMYKIFRVWELLFGRRLGKNGIGDTIRAEGSARADEDGTVYYAFHTWEALLSYFEVSVRELFKFKLRLPFKIWIPQLVTTSGMPMFASPYLFAIAFDNSDKSGGTFSISFAYTVSGANPFLASWLIANGGTPTSATYGAANMTYVTTANDGFAGPNNCYYCKAPATGSNTLAYSGGGISTLSAFAQSYSGCDQTTPVPSGAFSGQTYSSTSTLTLSIALSVINCWLAAAFYTYNNVTQTGASGATVRQTRSPTQFCSSLDSNGTVGTGTPTIVASLSGSTLFASGTGFAFQPFSAVGPSHVKSWDGVVQATAIKTYDGLALASTKTVNGLN